SADLQALGSNARHLGRAIVAPRQDLSERATVGPAPTMNLPPAGDRAHAMGADRGPHAALHRNHPGAFTFWCEGAQGTVSIVAPAANGARGLEHTHLVLDIPVGAQRTYSVEHRHAGRDPFVELDVLRHPELRAPAVGAAASREAAREPALHPDPLDRREIRHGRERPELEVLLVGAMHVAGRGAHADQPEPRLHVDRIARHAPAGARERIASCELPARELDAAQRADIPAESDEVADGAARLEAHPAARPLLSRAVPALIVFITAGFLPLLVTGMQLTEATNDPLILLGHAVAQVHRDEEVRVHLARSDRLVLVVGGEGHCARAAQVPAVEHAGVPGGGGDQRLRRVGRGHRPRRRAPACEQDQGKKNNGLRHGDAEYGAHTPAFPFAGPSATRSTSAGRSATAHAAERRTETEHQWRMISLSSRVSVGRTRVSVARTRPSVVHTRRSAKKPRAAAGGTSPSVGETRVSAGRTSRPVGETRVWVLVTRTPA